MTWRIPAGQSTIRTVDVYDHARELASRMAGPAPVNLYRDLRQHGLSATALAWRTAHGRLRRPYRGAYVDCDRELHLLDQARAALAVSPPTAVLGFHTAAFLLGFGVTRSPDIHIVVPAGTPFPQRPGIAAHQVTVPVGEPEVIQGMPCVPVDRCAVDLARILSRLNAITVLDAALRTGGCSIESLRCELARHTGLRGVRQARELIPWADGRAECRQESQLRLVLLDAGVSGFEPQVEVCDQSGWVRYRIDLGDPRHRVGAEYDGASHLDRARHRADRTRHNWLAERGWAMRYFTDHDLYYRPDEIVQVLRTAQRR